MSIENAKKFYESLLNDRAAMTELQKATEIHANNQLDESKRLALVEEHVLPFAQKRGFSFSVDDLKQVEKERLADAEASGKLSESELQAVSGGVFGGGICFFVGFAVGGPGLCFIAGIEI